MPIDPVFRNTAELLAVNYDSVFNTGL